jgi:ATP-dependent DNA helicase RecG
LEIEWCEEYPIVSDASKVERWLATREDEHIELKEAKRSYSFDKLVRYCAALANEGGGTIVLGISPKLPRRVVGSLAFKDLAKLAKDLYTKLGLRIRAMEVHHPDGRVVVLEIPSRPIAMPIEIGGTYWMRSGESLTGMSPDELRRIFDEASPDYSAETCSGATMSDLDRSAIEDFRRRWARKARDSRLSSLSDEQLLADAELIVGDTPTRAAMVLFGTHQALGRLLPQAELVFEYRSSEASGPAQQRVDLRAGFFSWYDRLWDMVNARNDLQHYQEGFFIWDVPTFDEGAVRELVLNAVSHRDYRMQGSVFVRQFQRRLEVVSPGGLPSGVTVETILWRQAPRNRRICEAFQRCGLVERSGQGMNRIYETCVRNSNALPDFKGTDDYQVSVTLRGVVEDPKFVAMLSKVAGEEFERFGTEHFLALNAVHRGETITDELRPALESLVELGVVERVRRGRLILSRRLYTALGRAGHYTRHRGLDRETNKQLLLRHICENKDEGSKMDELMQVLPSLSRGQVKTLVGELRDEGKIIVEGRTRASRWFPHPDWLKLQSSANLQPIQIQNGKAK